MRLERFPGPEDVARRAADIVARTVAARRDARLVLPAGGTPVPTYAELARRCGEGVLDLSGAHLFQLDELAGVAPADARSFHAFLREHLLDRVDRQPERDHLLDGASDDPEGEVARHAAALADVGGADLVLLGLGRNGHVAFNEPGSDADDGARVVELHDATRTALADRFGPDEAPMRGLTLGLREILATREVVLIVTGAGKADVLRDLVEGTDDAALPASCLARHPSLTILADADACERLVSRE